MPSPDPSPDGEDFSWWPNLTWSGILTQTGEINFSSYTDQELIEVGASSPFAGLVPSPPADWQPGISEAARGLLERRDAEPDPNGAGSALRPIGDLAILVALRKRSGLLASVTAVGDGTGGGVRGLTVAVLFGMTVLNRGLVGLLEEVTDKERVHHFVLAHPRISAERIFEMACSLKEEIPGLAVVVEAFAPDPARPRHLRIVLDQPETGSWRCRATTTGEAWQDAVAVGAEGEEWTELFAAAMSELAGGPSE